ncbi:MAG: ATP synthase F1 subunit delta [Bacteroidetes bacterium]|nr:ATP synthase F1 subunit delta [Bacteroidota bacterium]
MLQDRIAKRYAKSLFDLALEKNILEEVKKDFDMLDNLYHQSADLRMLLRSPIIASSHKWAILSKLLKGKVSEPVLQFIEIINRKGREGLLDNLWQEFTALYNSYKNITVVNLRTAMEFSAPAREALTRKIADALKTHVELKETVEPELIGGFAFQIDQRLYDGSVAAALQKVKREFSL